jgi:hypothetical protein
MCLVGFFQIRQYLLYVERHVGRSRHVFSLWPAKYLFKIKIVKLNNMTLWKTSLSPIKIYQITRRHTPDDRTVLNRNNDDFGPNKL